jgi:hypothetical protein
MSLAAQKPHHADRRRHMVNVRFPWRAFGTAYSPGKCPEQQQKSGHPGGDD